ncbi:MAG: M20/M25/M40 family metallo-hydrolase [Nannocystaceae bacterium]
MPRKKLRRALGLLGLGALALAGVCVTRAALLEPQSVDAGPPPDVPAYDAEAVARALSGAIQHKTVSMVRGGEEAAFVALAEHLRQSFPRVHATLEQETHGRSLIYRWPGQDPALAPILLLGHLDVVPVEPGTEDSWTHPPYSGEIAGGFVWGRGAMDDKTSVVTQLAAIEGLLAAGFAPRRGVVLAYGEDEEVGGDNGAGQIAKMMAARGDRYEFVLDEGGVILADGLPGVTQPIALVGVAEKGAASIELIATAEGGHSSMPPAHSAIGRLAAAVARLEAEQMPNHTGGPTRQMLDAIAPHATFRARLALANLWLLEPLVVYALTLDHNSAATVRTTTAPTIFEAGAATNVLATRARAIVNFRIAPGDSVEGVLAHVRAVIDDPTITASCILECRDPSSVSPAAGLGMETLTRVISRVHPDAVVAPFLVVAGTDARHYASVSDHIYRFLPVLAGKEDRKRVHGTDERISIAAIDAHLQFYAQVIVEATR